MRLTHPLLASAFLIPIATPAAPATSAYTCTTFQYRPGSDTRVTGINNKGEVVGDWSDPGHSHAFLRSPDGILSPLTSPSGSDEFTPIGINNLGQIAGPSFILNPDGTYIDIPPALAPPGHTYTNQSITGINDKGELTGTILEDWDDDLGTLLVFIRSAGGQYKIIDQRVTSFYPQIYTGPINNSGVVVEHVRYADGFLLKPDGTKVPLIYPGFPFQGSNPPTHTFGLNNQNVTVADADGADAPVIFSFVRTLDSQYPIVACPEDKYLSVYAINDRNVLAGASGGASGQSGFIATPTGSLPHLQVRNPDWSFGSHPIGQTSGTGRIFLSNAGPADLNIPGIYISGTGKLTDEVNSFRIKSSTCGSYSSPSVLMPGNSCFVEFTFTPQVNGWQTAALYIPNDSPTSPKVINIGGTGIGSGTLRVSNTSWHFAPHPVGEYSGYGVIYAYNPGPSTIKFNVRIDQDETSPSFTLVGGACDGSLAPFKSCAIRFIHYSSSPGLHTAILNLGDSSAQGPFRIPLYAYVTK